MIIQHFNMTIKRMNHNGFITTGRGGYRKKSGIV